MFYDADTLASFQAKLVIGPNICPEPAADLVDKAARDVARMLTSSADVIPSEETTTPSGIRAVYRADDIIGALAERSHSRPAVAWALIGLLERDCLEGALFNDPGRWIDFEVPTMGFNTLPLSQQPYEMLAVPPAETSSPYSLILSFLGIWQTEHLETWLRGSRSLVPIIDQPADEEGPVRQNIFVWRRKSYEITRSWELLKFVWQKESVKICDVANKVYGDASIKRRTISQAVRRLNEEMVRENIPLSWHIPFRGKDIIFSPIT